MLLVKVKMSGLSPHTLNHINNLVSKNILVYYNNCKCNYFEFVYLIAFRWREQFSKENILLLLYCSNENIKYDSVPYTFFTLDPNKHKLISIYKSSVKKVTVWKKVAQKFWNIILPCHLGYIRVWRPFPDRVWHRNCALVRGPSSGLPFEAEINYIYDFWKHQTWLKLAWQA